MKRNGSLKNLIVYCRESRDDGYANYERIETQRDILVEYCKKRNLGNIIDIIMDDNLSGTDFSRLEPVKERIRNKEVDIFVCKDASRIGRNLLDSLRFIEFLNDHKVELVFESEQYNEDMFPLIAWFNERRVKDDSLKIRRVLKHKMTTGDMVIKSPFGYEKQGNELIINEEAAKIVREIFELYANGMGCYEIATKMNKKGYPTPSQIKARHANIKRTTIWNKQHIERIVHHVIYSGDMPYGMREKVSYKSKKYVNKEKEEWIIVPNHHEPIVSREIFDKAQQRRRICKRYEITEKEKRIFSGLVFCGRCGSKIYSKTRKGRKNSMICFKSNVEGSVKNHIREGYGCNPHRIYEEDLLAYISDYISKFMQNPNFQREVLKEIGNNNKQKTLVEKEIKRLERQYEDLHDKASQVYDDKLNGVLPAFLFKKKVDEITISLNKIDADLKELKQYQEELNSDSNDGDSISSIIEAIHKNGITNENMSMLFKKIIVFEPNDITSKHMEEYNLSTEEYEYLSQNGGILFIQNFRYDYKLLHKAI